MTEISVNEIIQWFGESGEVKTSRIVWIDNYSNLAYIIDIYASNGFPAHKDVSEIIEAIETNKAYKLNEDPWGIFLSEEEIGSDSKKIRDENWQIISSLVSPQNEFHVIQKSTRSALINDTAKEHGVSKKTVYKNLRRYWQRGKNKNALLPDNHRKGGKGKGKQVSNKKLGRPRKYIDEIGEGINVDEETKKSFRTAIKRFYETREENSLQYAYNAMIKAFYTKDYRFEDGVKKPLMVPQHEIPTYSQFKYWYDKEMDISQKIKARKGAKKYELEHRPILGNSTSEVIGPGFKYQLDATVGNVYLVSRYNRDWIIGRPVIYFVVDVFSRMITGIYIGLEGPSWVGSMMTIANAATDKVKFCREYGIEIDDSEWPCHHMPDTILGDRGELEGELIETLINTLHVKVENTSSFRADWKGIVEQYFETVDTRVKPLLPGYIDTDFRERGARDYRLDAKLDIYQFTQILIKCVLHYNNYRRLDYYSRSEMMVSDDVPPIPIELWNWGIKNISGRLRTFQEDVVKLNLLLKDRARVSSRGIIFKGNLAYSCEKALNEKWFEIARNKGSWKVDVSYDPRNMDYIYLRLDDGRSYEKCYLLETQERYFHRTLDEINYLIEKEKLDAKKYVGTRLQSEVDLNAEIEHIVKGARKETESIEDKDASKSSKVTGIRTHRQNEKTSNRENEAFELDPNENVATTESNEGASKEESTESPSRIELLKRKQKETFDDE